MNQPIPHPGPADIIASNRGSHTWTADGRCAACETRPDEVAADYPCGWTVPTTSPYDDVTLLADPWEEETDPERLPGGAWRDLPGLDEDFDWPTR